MKGLMVVPGKDAQKKSRHLDWRTAQFILELAIAEDVSVEELLLNLRRG
jgi:hypothetical protein